MRTFGRLSGNYCNFTGMWITRSLTKGKKNAILTLTKNSIASEERKYRVSFLHTAIDRDNFFLRIRSLSRGTRKIF